MTINSSATSGSSALTTNGFAFGSGAGRAPRSEARDFTLGIEGFRYGDLYEPAKLAELDVRFREELAGVDAVLAARFEAYRAGAALTPPEESALLIEVGRPLGAFVARLFGVEPARQAQLDVAAREAAIFRMKHFVVRRASKKYPEDKLPAEDPAALRAEKVAEFREKFANPFVAADRGFVDEVIAPRLTRRKIISALDMTRGKRDRNPPRKHGNIPL